MGFIASESCGSFERSCQSIPEGPPHRPPRAHTRWQLGVEPIKTDPGRWNATQT